MSKLYDVIIIGAGPAGLTAALYAARANLKIAIIEKDAPGGKMVKTAKIANWPGLQEVEGPDLAVKLFDQVLSYGVDYFYGTVSKIVNGDEKEVVTELDVYRTKNIIIAIGTNERKLEIPGELVFYSKGISYCAVCDGALYKGKTMAVIGGGNSALEEALYLTVFATKIHLFHRRDQFRADEILIEEVKKHSKIEIHYNSIPLEILGNKHVEKLKIKDLNTNQEHIYQVDVIFPFIGQVPMTNFIQGLDISDSVGYIIVDENMETKIQGIYGVGDVREKNLRQIVTACSDGAIAANHIAKKINK